LGYRHKGFIMFNIDLFRNTSFKTLVVACVAAIALPACGDFNIGVNIGSGKGVKGSGVAATQSRDLPAFTSIETTGSGKVVIKVGETQSVKITADDNLLPFLSSEVKNGKLVLSVSKPISTKTTIKYEIKAPKIDRIDNSGAIATTASGFSGGSLTVDASGAGSVALAGKVDSLNVNLSGVGSLDADKLAADRVSAELSGVGSAELRAEKSIKANVSGVGSMTWRGAATDVSTNVSGIGSVRRG
jgi:Putative auto-transporter adhesin, head GIN domain